MKEKLILLVLLIFLEGCQKTIISSTGEINEKNILRGRVNIGEPLKGADISIISVKNELIFREKSATANNGVFRLRLNTNLPSDFKIMITGGQLKFGSFEGNLFRKISNYDSKKYNFYEINTLTTIFAKYSEKLKTNDFQIVDKALKVYLNIPFNLDIFDQLDYLPEYFDQNIFFAQAKDAVSFDTYIDYVVDSIDKGIIERELYKSAVESFEINYKILNELVSDLIKPSSTNVLGNGLNIITRTGKTVDPVRLNELKHWYLKAEKQERELKTALIAETGDFNLFDDLSELEKRISEPLNQLNFNFDRLIQIFEFNKDTTLQQELNKADVENLILTIKNKENGIENDLKIINETLKLNNGGINLLYETKKLKEIHPLMLTTNNKYLLLYLKGIIMLIEADNYNSDQNSRELIKQLIEKYCQQTINNLEASVEELIATDKYGIYGGRWQSSNIEEVWKANDILRQVDETAGIFAQEEKLITIRLFIPENMRDNQIDNISLKIKNTVNNKLYLPDKKELLSEHKIIKFSYKNNLESGIYKVVDDNDFYPVINDKKLLSDRILNYKIFINSLNHRFESLQGIAWDDMGCSKELQTDIFPCREER